MWPARNSPLWHVTGTTPSCVCGAPARSFGLELWGSAWRRTRFPMPTTPRPGYTPCGRKQKLLAVTVKCDHKPSVSYETVRRRRRQRLRRRAEMTGLGWEWQMKGRTDITYQLGKWIRTKCALKVRVHTEVRNIRNHLQLAVFWPFAGTRRLSAAAKHISISAATFYVLSFSSLAAILQPITDCDSHFDSDSDWDSDSVS